MLEGPEIALGQPRSDDMSWGTAVSLGCSNPPNKNVAIWQLEFRTPENDRTQKTFPADLWVSRPQDTQGNAIGKRSCT